jgi:hypothetical protein
VPHRNAGNSWLARLQGRVKPKLPWLLGRPKEFLAPRSVTAAFNGARAL